MSVFQQVVVDQVAQAVDDQQMDFLYPRGTFRGHPDLHTVVALLGLKPSGSDRSFH